MSFRVLVFAVLGVGLLGTVRAQPDPSIAVDAGARPSTVGPNGTVTFTLRVEGASLSAIDPPGVPPTRNLVPQQQTPSTHRTLSIQDGTFRRTVSFEWTFRPQQNGEARILPVDVVVNGERYTTREIRIDVAASPDQNTRSGRRSLDDPPAATDSKAWDDARLTSRSLFLRGRPSAETVYRNEQVVVEYRLFFRPHVRLRRSRMADAWDAPGFWREDLNVSSRPVPRTTTVRGRTYKTIVLKRVALFPTRAGALRVDPLRVETEAQGGQNGLRGRYEGVTLASDPLTIRVRSLPSAAPPAFDGAVGQFTMDVRVETDSVAVGAGTDLTVRVQGTGNLTTMSPPILEMSPPLDAYGPEVDTEIDRSGRSVRGTKTFTYTLVPQRSGRRRLPPVTFSYFDPERKRYETLHSDPVVLWATGEAEPTAGSLTGEGFPVGDVAGLITDGVQWTRTNASPLHRQRWPYGVLLVPILLAVGGIVYRRRLHVPEPEAPSDHPGEDRTRLEQARRHHRNDRVREFYHTLEETVRTVLAERLGLPPDAPRIQLHRQLEQHRVPDADREALRSLFDTCDQAQFGPDDPAAPTRKNVLDRAEALLRRLEHALPKSTPRAT